MNHLNRFISNKTAILLLVSVVTLVIGTHQFLIGKKSPNEAGHVYTYYNNYVIFKQSVVHLLENKNPYALYPEEHADYYKYSPSFAMVFGVFALFPDFIGLNLWNLLNALVLLFAVYSLPGLPDRKKGLIVLLCLVEMVTSIQNSQSNALVAGLMIFAFSFMERKNHAAAALFMVLSAFIKLFGMAGFALFLLYPKVWKSVIYSAVWMVVLGFLPLLIVSFGQMETLYVQWWDLLKMDHSASYGLSVAGVLHSWTGADTGTTAVTLAGVALFMVPFVVRGLFREYTSRLLMLAFLLIWVVIFNHKAESPTFIIAFAGISLWYYSRPRSPLDTALFIFAFVVTSLSPTDLFPRSLRNAVFEPYMLKALPAILVWLKVLIELTVVRSGNGQAEKEHSAVAER